MRMSLLETEIAVGGYAGLGSVSDFMNGAAGGGARIVAALTDSAGPVGLVDIQGLVFFPDPGDASLAGWTGAVGVGYRWAVSVPTTLIVGVHVSYGLSLLRVDGQWGSAAFNQEWRAGQAGFVDADVMLPFQERLGWYLRPRYMLMPESGFLGHFLGVQTGVRYLW
jgi:hypothetical protein